MFLIFGITLVLFSYLISPKIKTELLIVLYLFFSFVSPVVYFLDSKIVLHSFFHTDPFSQLCMLTLLLVNGFYWIYILVNDKKKEIFLIREESLFLFILLLGFLPLKILLILTVLLLNNISFKNKLEVKLKIIPATLLLIILFLNDQFPQILHTSVFLLTFAIYWLDSKTIKDHYILMLMVAVMYKIRSLGVEFSVVFSLLIFFSYMRYKFGASDLVFFQKKLSFLTNISVKINQVSRFCVLGEYDFFKTKNLSDTNRSKSQAIFRVHENEYFVAFALKWMFFIGLIIYLMEVLWLQQ